MKRDDTKKTIFIVLLITVCCALLYAWQHERGMRLQWQANAVTMGGQASWYQKKIDSNIVSGNSEIKGTVRQLQQLFPELKAEIAREFDLKLRKVEWYNKNILDASGKIDGFLRDTLLMQVESDCFGFELMRENTVIKDTGKHFRYCDGFFDISQIQIGNKVTGSISYQDTIYQVIKKGSRAETFKGTGFGWWFKPAPLQQEIKMGSKDAVIKYSRVIHLK